VPKKAPKGICENTAGRVMKVSPGPAAGSKPKAKTAGRIRNPAITAINVSRDVTQRAALGRFSRCEM